MATFEYIKKRCSALESDRQTWEDHWQDILDYVMPSNGGDACCDR